MAALLERKDWWSSPVGSSRILNFPGTQKTALRRNLITGFWSKLPLDRTNVVVRLFDASTGCRRFSPRSSGPSRNSEDQIEKLTRLNDRGVFPVGERSSGRLPRFDADEVTPGKRPQDQRRKTR
jgi:hypothetical protein